MVDSGDEFKMTVAEAEPFQPRIKDGEVDNNGSYISKESGDENKTRGNWGRQIDFMITCVGYCVGLSNIWRFPYLCMRNGGGAFLVPYFFFLFLGGMPLYFLEISVAQFSSRSALTVWYLCPLAKGLGWGMIVISGMCTVYYQIIISWVLYYLGSSFQYPVPWASCDNAWNTEFCSKRGGNTSSLNLTLGMNDTLLMNGTSRFDDGQAVINGVSSWVRGNITNGTRRMMTPTEEFWQYNNLEMTDGINNFGGLRWQLVACHLVGWITNILCIIKGVKSVGKVVYVTATLPYVFLIILLVRGCTLPGASTGIIFYLKPDFNKLLEFKVWVEACMQIFYSLGVAWGGMITMASYNKFHHNLYRDAMTVPLICCFTSFFAGFVTFSVVGFMAEELGVPVEEVISSGPGLAFIAYPEALAKLPFAPAWSVIFFFLLFLVGLDTQFATFETLVSGVVDQFPNIFRGKKVHTLIGLALVNVVVGLIFCSRAGIYYFQIFDWYFASFSIMIFACIECVAVVYLYGGRRFMNDVETMLGRRPCVGWLLLLGGITPITLIICLGFSMVNFVAPSYGDYTYPLWAKLVGWTLAAVSLVPVVVCAVHQLATSKGTMIERLKHSIRPDITWGPAVEKYREERRNREEAQQDGHHGLFGCIKSIKMPNPRLNLARKSKFTEDTLPAFTNKNMQ